MFKGCDADATPSENNCSDAFGSDQFWMPTEDPGLMEITFLELIQPTKIVYQANPLSNLKPNSITV